MRAFGYDLDTLVVAHVVLAIVPVLIGLVIALPIGWGAYRSRVLRAVLVPLTGALYTIPSLALIVAMPLILGTGFLSPLNVGVALTIYAVALLVRSVVDALDAVPPAVTTAAVAVGYRPAGLLLGVQLASVSSFSLVTVGALVGIDSLGSLMTSGFEQSYPLMITVAIVGVLVLAFAFDALWLFLGRVLAPWNRVRTGA
jgi:osmoprotectant transport system permease protein